MKAVTASAASERDVGCDMKSHEPSSRRRGLTAGGATGKHRKEGIGAGVVVRLSCCWRISTGPLDRPGPELETLGTPSLRGLPACRRKYETQPDAR